MFPSLYPDDTFIILQKSFLWIIAWEFISCLVKFWAILSKKLETIHTLITVPDDNFLYWFVSRLDCYFCQFVIIFILSCTAIFKYKIVLNVLFKRITDSYNVILVVQCVFCGIDSVLKLGDLGVWLCQSVSQMLRLIQNHNISFFYLSNAFF